MDGEECIEASRSVTHFWSGNHSLYQVTHDINMEPEFPPVRHRSIMESRPEISCGQYEETGWSLRRYDCRRGSFFDVDLEWKGIAASCGLILLKEANHITSLITAKVPSPP